jgi:hypothetical protein
MRKKMHRFSWLVALMLMAVPVLAQDDDFGFSGGDDLFADDSFGGFDSGGFETVREIDPLADVKNWLGRSKAAPMDKKQEKDLKKLYEKEVKAMAKDFEERFGVSLNSAMAQSGRSGFRRGNSEQSAEVTRLSQHLVDKVIAALRIEQQAALRKYQSEQARSSKLNRIVLNMARVGTPMTAEQKPEIEALLARESRLRTLMIIEAKGESYQKQVALLEAQTIQRIVALLDSTQKAALVAAKTRPAANSRDVAGS